MRVFNRILAYLVLILLVMATAACSKFLPASGKGASDKLEAGMDEQYKKAYEDKAVVLDTVADIFSEPRINTERITQVLFNQAVVVLEEKDNWTKVKTEDGSVGWVRSKYIDRNCSSIIKEKYKERVVVTGKKKQVHPEPQAGVTLIEAVMGTEFFIVSMKDSNYEVALPLGMTGWISTKDTIKLPAESPIPKTTAEDFIATAHKFAGLQYLSGGMGAIGGIDSSGLVYICGRINGIDLPRSARDQYEFIQNSPEDKDSLKPGDLVFFSLNEDLSDVSQVGIYIGNNSLLYADSTKGSVTVRELGNEYFDKRFRGIRRIFD